MSLEDLWYQRAPGWQRALAAVILAPLSVVFGAGVLARTALWRGGLKRATRVEGLRVVSVGNRVVGGAGKTPLVIFLARWAQAQGHRVAVLSRGYARTHAEPVDFDADAAPPPWVAGDEPLLIARRCPGVRLFVGPDRVASAQKAKAAGFDFALLDDGFQHWQLHRDVDLVVEATAGNGHLLPWGPAREPRSALSRADLLIDGSEVALGLRPDGLKGPAGEALSLDSLRGQAVLAVAGIARPWRFEATLEGLGAKVVQTRWFDDHHAFSAGEIEALTARSVELNAVLVTTEKDAKRLPAGAPFHVVTVAVSVDRGLEKLARALDFDADKAPR